MVYFRCAHNIPTYSFNSVDLRHSVVIIRHEVPFSAIYIFFKGDVIAEIVLSDRVYIVYPTQVYNLIKEKKPRSNFIPIWVSICGIARWRAMPPHGL